MSSCSSSSANESSGFSVIGCIAYGSNKLADVADCVFSHGGEVIASAGLGAIGGKFTWMGWQTGLLHGAVSSMFYSSILRPAGTIVHKNSGMGPNQFHPNTESLLYLAGGVAAFAVPYLVMTHGGEHIVDGIKMVAPTCTHWLVQAAEGSEYTFWGSMTVNIIPAALSVAISTLYKVKESEVRRTR